MLNYKFRLYPTKEQEKRLENNLAVCRWIYNRFVEQTRTGFLSRNEMNYYLTELKQSEPWLNEYHSKMLQMVSTQLEAAQKAISELRKKGYKGGKIKFVRYGEYNTFTYNQSGFKLKRHSETDLLWLSKIGYLEIRKHREPIGKIKQILISKSNSDKWHAIITCEPITYPQDILEIGNRLVGIDVGIRNFAYDSEGNSTPNPLNLEKSLKPLKRIQRKISRRQKDSRNYRKALKFYQRIHEKIANRRKDFLHKLSTTYAKRYDVVFVERLQILNMSKNHNLARSILDSGWGTFCDMLDYKCRLFVEVPSRNTSVDCSKCGNAVPKGLAVRIHSCDKCGFTLDRDYNASLNILKKGLYILGCATDGASGSNVCGDPKGVDEAEKNSCPEAWIVH